MMNNLHGIIFSYLANPDLRELTLHRNTCSLPYGGRYRLIDFMLSNMVNAGISDVGMIVRANYQSLLDHLGSGKDWDLSRKHGGLRILPPFSYTEKQEGVYRGRMDALAGVRSYLQNIRQDHVVLAGGDMAVNLPLADVYEQHIRSGADITAVCTAQTMGISTKSDYLLVGANDRITDVSIHPAAAQEGYTSLEVYVLSKELLLSLVDHCAAHNIASFSGGVLQSMVDKLKICPYVFDGYAARIQSVSDYFARSMELLDPAVRAQLFAPERPIRTKDQSNPSTYYGPGAKAVNSLVADGCIIEGEVENSVLFRGVRIEKGAKVSNCVLMQGTVIQAGAMLKYAIADKNVRVNPGRMLMGHNTYPLAISKNEIV